MEKPVDNNLTDAQNELYGWIKNYMKDFQHSPSIRQMMQAMGLKSPAPIQSRLKHLQEKGYISWQEGKARTMQIVDEITEGVPIIRRICKLSLRQKACQKSLLGMHSIFCLFKNSTFFTFNYFISYFFSSIGWKTMKNNCIFIGVSY